MLRNSPPATFVLPTLRTSPLTVTHSHPPRRCRSRRPPACCTSPPPTRSSLVDTVEAHLRHLGADEAADLAYVSLTTGLPSSPAPHWQAALDHLAHLGLRGDELSRFTSRLGIEATLQLDPEQVHSVTQYLSIELDLSPSMLRRILISRPLVLTADAAIRAAIPALRASGLHRNDLQYIALRWPGLLAVDAARLRRSIAFLCSTKVGFSVKTLRSLLRRAPWVLVYDVDTDMAPSALWLLEVHGSARGVEHSIRTSPQLLGTPRRVMQQVYNFLRDEIRLSENAIQPVLRSFPPMLTCSVDDALRPAMMYLRNDLRISAPELAKAVRAFPSILTLDVDRDMRVVVDYFRGVGIGNVGRFVTRLPPVLGYDLEKNIIPKMEYVENELGLSSYDIMRFPGYFSYSLDRCIEPRTKFLQAMGRSVTETGLNMALALTDVDFCERVARTPLSQYYSFRKAISTKKKAPMEAADPRKDEAKESNYLASLERADGLASVDKTADVKQLEKNINSNPSDARDVKRRRRRFRATLSRMPWDELL